MEEFEDAKDKVMMGTERRSMVMTENEKKLTAYHEAGHAVLAILEPDSDPIHKATIIPRGRALGLVMRLPETDRISLSRAKIKADLSVAMGGRIAEELIFGYERVTTGASSDIRMATDMARRMVTDWGMSDKLGFQHYGADQEEVFLGHSVTQTKHMSSQTASIVDAEVKLIIDTAYERATKLLTDNLDKLHLVAQALLEYETLSGDEIKALLRGEQIVRDEEPAEPAGGKPRSSVPTSGSAPGGLPQGA
jgi:cell division protease FtsH